MALSEQEREAALRLVQSDLRIHAAHCAKIKTKTGGLAPFVFNQAQEYVHERLEKQKKETGKVRALILKGRQQGVSTYVGERYYHQVTTWGKSALIVAHEDKATSNLFEMVKRYQEHNPLAPSTKASNAKELIFGAIDAGYKLATAGTDDVGRGNTSQLIHGSEFAYWRNPQKHLAGLGNTVADVAGTEIILESTANGVGNAFHSLWQDAEAGRGEYIAIFVPWFWQEEYRSRPPVDLELTDEESLLQSAYGLDNWQIQWRRNKLISYGPGYEWLFKQEYPNCISGDARVGTDRGLIPMRELALGDTTSSGKVTAAWATGLKKVVRVRTRMGYEVVCTPEHRLGAVDGSWIRADEAAGCHIRLIQPCTTEAYATVTWSLFSGVPVRVTVDERWGRLLGLIAGNGALTSSTLSIAADSKDRDLVDLIAALVQELFGDPYTRKGMGSKGGGAEVRFSSTNLGSLWQAFGILQKGTKEWKRRVCVPECIWRSPISVVREFLKGLYETDGFAGYRTPRISVFSKHEELLKDVQQLLLLFGITSRRVSRPAVNGKGFRYTSNTLDLRVNESRAFGERVGFLSGRKQARCAEWCEDTGKGRKAFDLVLEDVVESVEDAGDELVFDANVPGRDCFDAGGVLVHNCSAEAFQTSTTNPLINPDQVMAAVLSEYRDTLAPLLIGCDPAGDGMADADRTAIVFRKGRMVSRIEYHSGLNTMQIAGKLAEYSREYGPDGLFVDKGGLGAGVYDRLRELGVPVIGVNSAEKPTDIERFENKRAEMWWLMAGWFADAPNRIPNDAALISDLTAPQPKVSSNGRRLLEKKEDMKKRGLRSPDGADALALTFAQPVLRKAEYVARTWQAEQAPTTAGY